MSNEQMANFQIVWAGCSFSQKLNEPEFMPDLGVRWSLGLEDVDVLQELCGDAELLLQDPVLEEWKLFCQEAGENFDALLMSV